jgi:hypothetical protein
LLQGSQKPVSQKTMGDKASQIYLKICNTLAL